MNRVRERVATNHIPRVPQLGGLVTFYTEFSAGEWTGNELRIPASKHHIPVDSFLASVSLHMLVNGEMRCNTWGIMESDLALNRADGSLVLRASAPYAGELAVVACPVRRG